MTSRRRQAASEEALLSGHPGQAAAGEHDEYVHLDMNIT